MDGQRILEPEDAEALRRRFESEMVRPVDLVLFVGEANRDFSEWTEQLLRELSGLTDRIRLRVYREGEDGDEFERYRVSPRRTPTILIDPDRGYLIRYTGAPSGHEAWGFIETMILASRDESGLPEGAVAALRELERLGRRVRVVVFITPTCPYCPHQVLMTNKMALAAPGWVEAECLEAWENPDLAEEFGVSAVPDTAVMVIEDGREVVKKRLLGLQPDPEKYALDVVKAAIS